MIILETNRLIIRNLSLEDAAIMYDYRNNKKCNIYQRGQFKNKEEIINLINHHKNDVISNKQNTIFSICFKENNKMIGEIVIMPSENFFPLVIQFHIFIIIKVMDLKHYRMLQI